MTHERYTKWFLPGTLYDGLPLRRNLQLSPLQNLLKNITFEQKLLNIYYIWTNITIVQILHLKKYYIWTNISFGQILSFSNFFCHLNKCNGKTPLLLCPSNPSDTAIIDFDLWIPAFLSLFFHIFIMYHLTHKTRNEILVLVLLRKKLISSCQFPNFLRHLPIYSYLTFHMIAIGKYIIISCHVILYEFFWIPGSYLLLLVETFYCLWKSLLRAEVHPEVKLVKNIVGIWKGSANKIMIVL